MAGLVPSDRHIGGVIEMMLDATQRYNSDLSDERLFGWHVALFSTGRSGRYKIVVGDYRNYCKDDLMEVVSGATGWETVHDHTFDAELLEQECS